MVNIFTLKLFFNISEFHSTLGATMNFTLLIYTFCNVDNNFIIAFWTADCFHKKLVLVLLYNKYFQYDSILILNLGLAFQIKLHHSFEKVLILYFVYWLSTSI